MKKKTLAILSGVTAAATITVGGIVIAQAHKTVELLVESESVTVSTFGSTVEDALDKGGIEISEHDLVVPALDDRIVDGTVISVRYGRPITAVIDGEEITFWSTADTLDEALLQYGLTDPNVRVSLDRSTPLGREGLTFSATSPKNVVLVHDGLSYPVVTSAPDVATLLEEGQILWDEDDRLTPAPTDPIVEGATITLQRVTITEVTETPVIKREVVTAKSNDMYTDEKKVTTKGKDGKKSEVYKVTTVDGVIESKTLVSSTVLAEPVTEYVTVGTKKRPTPTAPAVATGSVWDRLAQCESGGRWNINSGNGFSGGLQFTPGTWRAHGGTKYAPYAYQATREQQIEIAEKVLKTQGWGAWPGCSRKLGLR